MLLFGVTGDLAGRYLMPALGALHEAGRLPEDFRVLGASTRDWDDARLRAHLGAQLDRFAKQLPPASREALLRAVHFHQVKLDQEGSIAEVLAKAEVKGPLAVYMALPPRTYPKVLRQLASASLARGSRIAIEKPYGLDLASARELQQQTSPLTRALGARAIYLVDFLLGMTPLQNLIELRRANPLLAASWRREVIDRVELHWEETLGLEGRATYFDRAGMLRDVVQSHVLQLLATVAMELPTNPDDARAMQEARLSVVRSIRKMGARDVVRDTRRARYGKGILPRSGSEPDRPTVAYVDEEGVDPARNTETFAQLLLWVDTPRWQGVPFVIRSGKALSRMRKEVVLHLRRGLGYGEARAPTRLRVGIDGPTDLELTLLGSGGGLHAPPTSLTFAASPPPSSLPAYASMLDDLLRDRSILAVLPEEAAAAWEVLTPVLEGWARNEVPLETYPAGSAGPDGDWPRSDAAGGVTGIRVPSAEKRPELPRR